MATTANHGTEQLADAGIILGNSPGMQFLNSLVRDVASTNIPVLLLGESGTGKEVYARLIHRLSGSGVLNKLCCSALDAGSLVAHFQESLHPSGEIGNGGAQTLFLDGIDELDLACQRVLLTLLPDGEPKSGGLAVRLISSTSTNLSKEVGAGRFRRELYFRINGVALRLPPLRERNEDIPVLLEHFLARHAGELRKKAPMVHADTLELLTSYEWPGNIRELENVARKMVALGDLAMALSDLRANPANLPKPSEIRSVTPLKAAARAASQRAEKELIFKALEQTHWNRKRAARELQISYKALLYKIKQIGVEIPGSEEL